MGIPSPKIVLIGKASMGKTCLITSFIYRKFKEESSTIGASFYQKTFDCLINGVSTPLKAEFWDTAGQDRYYSLMPMYIRKSSAVILCMSQDEANIADIEKYIKIVQDYIPELKIHLCVTKIDLENSVNKEVIDSIRTWYSKNGDKLSSFNMTSSKTGEGVEEFFQNVILDAHQFYLKNYEKKNEPISLTKNESKSCCILS